MVSSVTEGDIKKLRRAGYLHDDIAHRLPDEGQLIPTLEPQERVVFLTHFLRRLGFPLHPFVRGLIFYYGLDFHDLAPNFILNISVFIVVCEAFLCVRPLAQDLQRQAQGGARQPGGVRRRHGGQDGQHPMVRGLFCGDPKGVAIRVVLHHRATRSELDRSPRVPIRTPTRLMSWKETGLSWGDEKEVTRLQTCV